MRSVGVAVVILLGIGMIEAPAQAGSARVASSAEAASVVVTQDVSVQGDRVTGQLHNTSSRHVRDVQLLIRYQWLWNNERHPGTDNPGRAEYATVDGDLAPDATLSFTHTIAPPLPERSDGSFKTTAEVVGFTEVAQ